VTIQLNSSHSLNASKWRRYARDFQANDDPYGTFFAAWIALVILARDVESQVTSPKIARDGDSESIEKCFDVLRRPILRAVHSDELRRHRLNLSRRHEGRILRPERRSRKVPERLGALARAWTNPSGEDSDACLLGMQTLLIEVRNSLFHGAKIYNDDVLHRENDDKSLLQDLNPVLLAVVDTLLEL